MEPTSPKKFLLFLELVGIVTCTILIFVDLKIKHDLINAAIRLENRLGEAAKRTGESGSILPDSVSGRISDNSEATFDAPLEMEAVRDAWAESFGETGNNPKETNRDARGRYTRIPPEDNGV